MYHIREYTDVGYDLLIRNLQMLNRHLQSLHQRHLRDWLCLRKYQWQHRLQHQLRHRLKILFKKAKYRLHLHRLMCRRLLELPGDGCVPSSSQMPTSIRSRR